MALPQDIRPLNSELADSITRSSETPWIETKPGQTWTKGTPNSWMSSSADEKLGLVYLPMGNVAADYISTGRRPRSNQVSS